jgi:hypothetical protein
MEYIECKKCNITLNEENYPTLFKNTWQGYCSKCFLESIKEKNRIKSQYNKIAKREKLNPELSKITNCEICNIEFNKIDTRQGDSRNYDHNHITGKVRGVICNRCNHLLGIYRDNINLINQKIEHLNKMKKYLQERDL